MFGRRNPDQPSDHQTMPLKSDLDLDMLDDLPDILADEAAKPAAPPAMPAQADPAPEEPAWPAAAPAILGPSVTQLLREAEATPQPADEGAVRLFEPAPAITTQFPAYSPAVEPIAAAEPAVIGEPVAAPAPVAARAAALDRARVIAESVIGPDDFFDGRYRSERGVRIQGNARGSIEFAPVYLCRGRRAG